MDYLCSIIRHVEDTGNRKAHAIVQHVTCPSRSEAARMADVLNHSACACQAEISVRVYTRKKTSVILSEQDVDDLLNAWTDGDSQSRGKPSVKSSGNSALHLE